MNKIIFFLAGVFYTGFIFAGQLTYKNETIYERNNLPRYNIRINYPQILAPATNGEKNFNHLVKATAIEKAEEFKKTLSELDTNNLPQSVKANGSSITVTYDLYTITPSNIISLRYLTNSYVVGSAHGSNIYNSINYDISHNKPLALHNLFKPDSNYLNLFSSIATSKIKGKLAKHSNGQLSFFKEGLSPTTKNYEVWNLTPSGFKLTFNESQVAPYVFGPQEIVVAYSRLASYYAPGTLLSNCSKYNNCKITKQQ
jgi:Protein of unknown function (DUF3298)